MSSLFVTPGFPVTTGLRHLVDEFDRVFLTPCLIGASLLWDLLLNFFNRTHTFNMLFDLCSNERSCGCWARCSIVIEHLAQQTQLRN